MPAPRFAAAKPPPRPPVPDTDAEVSALRKAAILSPVVMWRVDSENQITWANAAYLTLLKHITPDGIPRWPLAQIFPDTDLAPPGTPGRRRLSLQFSGTGRNWFEVAAHQDEAGGGFFCAIPVDETVEAETSLLNFRQMLTNTFAHLQTGLCIFDDRRQLIMFNPALADMTLLSPEWLSGRPTLGEFLDRLRDKHLLPEPKDYREWRNRLLQIDSAAAEGSFDEDWTLPSGQTFRVRGQPHHQGGLAFTLEDVTVEISLSARFRAELDLNQSVLDALDDAVAVFSPTGMMVISNAAYDALWGDGEAGDILMGRNILDAVKIWQNRCEPSPVLGDIRDFAMQRDGRASWHDTVVLTDRSQELICAVCPMKSGMTLVRFVPSGPVPEFRHRQKMPLAG